MIPNYRDIIAARLMRLHQMSQGGVPPEDEARFMAMRNAGAASMGFRGGAPGSDQFAADEAASMARKAAGGGNGPAGPGWGGTPQPYVEIAPGVPAPYDLERQR